METLSKLLTAAPGVLLTFFSLYFTYRKIFHRVLAFFSYGGDILAADGVRAVTLINRKDRPLTIFELYATVEDSVLLQVEKFSPPLILKPLESIEIHPKPFSAYMLDGEEYRARLGPPHKVDIYLVLDRGLLKCKLISQPDVGTMRRLMYFRRATKLVRRFNGQVYGFNVIYAICYGSPGNTRTAFVTKAGIIDGDWGLAPNRLQECDLASEATVKAALDSAMLDKVLGAYHVQRLP